MLDKLFRVFTLNYLFLVLFWVLFWVVFITVAFFWGAVKAVIDGIKDNPMDRKSFEEYKKEFRRRRV